MQKKWVEKTDSQGNKIIINPQVVWVLKQPLNLDEHLTYLYQINTNLLIV